MLGGGTGRHETGISPNREISNTSGVWAKSCKNAGEAATTLSGICCLLGAERSNSEPTWVRLCWRKRFCSETVRWAGWGRGFLADRKC